jgi:hypothetical protein
MTPEGANSTNSTTPSSSNTQENNASKEVMTSKDAIIIQSVQDLSFHHGARVLEVSGPQQCPKEKNGVASVAAINADQVMHDFSEGHDKPPTMLDHKFRQRRPARKATGEKDDAQLT